MDVNSFTAQPCLRLAPQVVPRPSTITGNHEGRCALGTPLRRSRKEVTCRQEP
jgi:hypothetical protein